MKMDIVNNVDVDLLPDFVQDAILKEFSNLSIKHKLIIYSRLVHGHLFKVTSNDLFNICKQTSGVTYRNFIKKLTKELTNNANHKTKKTRKRNTDRTSNKQVSKKAKR